MEPNFLSRLLYTIFENLPIIPVAGFGLMEMMMGLGGVLINLSLEALQTAISSTNSILVGDKGGTLGFVTDNLSTMTTRALLITRPLAAIIAFVCWVIGLYELLVQDRLTPETLVKSLARFGVVFVLSDNTFTIYTFIKGFGKGLNEDFMGVFTTTGTGAALDAGNTIKVTTLQESLAELATPEGFISSTLLNAVTMAGGTWILPLVYAIIIAIPILLFAGAYYLTICLIQCSRLIELEIRAMFLPISFALLADDGWRGAGGRYIKKFVAICCQGVILIGLGGMAQTLMMTVIKNECSELFCGSMVQLLDNLANLDPGGIFIGICMMWGVGIAIISLMFKSINLVNEVFGA